jgi:2'-5' RNA ligase
LTDTSRLFFALWPDDETRLKLACLSRSLAANGYRPVSMQNLHVTLVFLGQVDAATEILIKHSATGISAQPFVLTFDRLSYWPKPKVLCLTSTHTPDKLAMLVAALADVATGYGLQIDARPYQPHITLVRPAKNLPDIDCDPLLWRAESFCLMESCSGPDGVSYKVRQQWPFIDKHLQLFT